MIELLENQKQLLRSLERSLDNFKKIGRNNLTSAKIRSRLNGLKELWKEFQQGHAALQSTVSLASQQSVEYFKDNLYDTAEDTFQTTSDYMAECLEEIEPYVNPNQSVQLDTSTQKTSSAFSFSHLPPITLPPFDGKYDEWESFRDRFTSLIIDNSELTDFARMHFLTASLKYRARECIQHLSVTADNFTVAWDTLKARFECKRRLLNVHLNTLLNLPAIHCESIPELQVLRDKTNATVAALKNLDRSSDQLWDDILVCLISQKLDSHTRKTWNLKNNDVNTLPSSEDLFDFLDTRIRALEEWKLPLSSSDKSNKASNTQKSAALTPLRRRNRNVPYAKPIIFLMHVRYSQRRVRVNVASSLSKTVAVLTVSVKVTRKHHSLLHDDSNSSLKPDDQKSSNPPAIPVESPPDAINLLNASAQQLRRSSVLLATAWVTVTAPSGRSVEVRALLDQGSEMTFITERLAQSLRLKRVRMPTSISAVGGVTVGTCRHAAQITISPRSASAPGFSTTALILKSLTAYSPQRVLGESVLGHMGSLSWADRDPLSADPIDLLIGADLYGEIILDGIRKSTGGRPIVQNTVFGWVISGPTSRSEILSHASFVNSGDDRASITSLHCSTTLSLDKELRQFWETEEIPRRIILTPEEEACEQHFCSTHSRRSDGRRYTVRLPFKTKPPIDIGDSRAIAEKRLTTLTRRL
ncbi:PREDICTED: uncharacterized protein LOC105571109 [Vollenhovia emeryi]|uniref:uncharacterized protein LOC105571109 n=1 Tax=Vollenhovia emeryi TaxID=411798 RepID=UPI0005F50D25|nr:PREDICTED: uncharacterized protein LOC105571109 [Vollenhovia emeryi]